MFKSNQVEFPFPYKIQVSKRAKRLNLKVSAEKGIQLTVPPRTSKTEALAFLQENTAWIEKNQHLWQQYQPNTNLPEQIQFPALQQQWKIEYIDNAINKRPLIIERPEYALVYFGKDDDTVKLTQLRQWCQNKARQFLHQRMLELSIQYQLPFNKLSFRSQQTLWGSCTHAKNISLNYKLIFLPLYLIDYVLVHELAHTIYLNHGKHFWQLVAKFIPNYKKCCQELRAIGKLIPNWF